MSSEPDGRALTERLRAERDERRRLAELIHDGPVQLVAALAQMLDAARRALEAGDTESVGHIVERALVVARDAGADLREIVSGIEPHALRELGLAAALAELAERHAARRGVVFELDVTTGDELGEGAQSGLYQIVRDAVDQAIRRGPPATVKIALHPTATGGVELTIADDGKRERRETVLAALEERAGDLNGSFVGETTGDGTAVTVRLPPTAVQL